MAAHKRPLGAVAPEQEQEAACSPRKRLRRAGLIVMWLEKGKARVVTVGQVAQMLRQAQLDVANSVMERLPNILERVLGEHFGAFQSSIMGCIEDKVQSIVKTEMQEQQAISLPTGVYEPPRQISEGFPETGGITRVKLRFVNVDRPEDTLYTCCPVQWHNRENAKVAIFDNDRQITQGHLSKLQIEILAVHAEFFTERGQEDFTKEEFNKQIYMHKGKESVLTTVNLTNGECSLGSVIFTESSQRKNLRLTARVKRQNLVVRVQEAITDPFVVKDRRSIFNEKSTTPSKEDAVHQLKGISPKGKRCEKLASKNITKVKHLLRHYHKDNFGLQKLTGMKKGDWDAMIKHATTSVPGDEIYSYWVQEDNCEILFDDFYDLIGKMTDDYVPYSVNDVDQFPQHKVNNWKMSAYKKFDERESSGDLTPDYFMNDGRLVRAVPLNNDAGPSVQARTTWQYPNDLAAQDEFGCQRPLNGFSRAAVLSNNDAGPSNQETLPFSQPTYGQTMHQGLGQQDPLMLQNGTPYYVPQGNFNDQGQGSFSAQPTIPSHILLPVPEDDPITFTGASLTAQQNGQHFSFSTTDAPVTSYPVATDAPVTSYPVADAVAGTFSDGVSLGTSSLNHVPDNMSSGPPSDEFDWVKELLAVGEYEADQGIAPANNGELPNSNIQSHGLMVTTGD